MSSFSDRDEREIDEYHDQTSSNDSSSSDSSSTNEKYSSGVPRVPLEVLQEEMKKRAASGSSIGSCTSA